MQNLNSIRALALDFDGTLVDSYSVHGRARKEAFKKNGLGDIDERLHDLAHNHGSSPYEIIGWILKQVGQYDEGLLYAIIKEKKAIYREIAIEEGLPPIPGAVEFIKTNASIRTLGIVTVSHLAEVTGFLNANGLDGVVLQDLIVTGDIPGFEPKPSPYLYLEFLKRAGLEGMPERVLGVEDSVHGIESLKRANMASVAIATTHSTEEWSDKTGEQAPDTIVSGYKELQGLLS